MGMQRSEERHGQPQISNGMTHRKTRKNPFVVQEAGANCFGLFFCRGEVLEARFSADEDG